MIKYTRRTVAHLRHIFATVRTVWRMICGRLYVFRDESDAFLAYIEDQLEGTTPHDLSKDVRLAIYVSEALAEIERRKRRR